MVVLLVILVATMGYCLWHLDDLREEMREKQETAWKRMDNLSLMHDTHVEDTEEEIAGLHERISQVQEEYGEANRKQREAAERDVRALSGGLRSTAKRVRRLEERVEPLLQREAERGYLEYAVELTEMEEAVLDALSGQESKNASTVADADRRRAEYKKLRKQMGIDAGTVRRIMGISERTGQRYEAWLRETK